MAVLEVIKMGHPTLRQVARELTPEEITSDATAELIEDMRDTLHAQGGIGLAAPQVNQPIRLAVIEMESGTSRYGDFEAHGFSVYINPVLRPQPRVGKRLARGTESHRRPLPRAHHGRRGLRATGHRRTSARTTRTA